MDAAAADGAITEADGLLPGGVTASDGALAGIARLSPALLDALRQASGDAARQGVVIQVNSGWRSTEYQDQLLQEAVTQYGSEAEAARWVATSATSAHVAGEAIDIGSFDAVAWLSAHGAGYGLCQTYENESWHFELRTDAISGGCPAPCADPTADPRMQG
jgi:D-alanyl-D-alanine carboxypeptidase